MEMYFLPREGYSSFSGSQDCINGNGSFESLQKYGFYEEQEPISTNDPSYDFYYQTNGDSFEIPDFPDACLKFMNDILMEEDLEISPATLQDFHALQATEKSFYDVIGETYPPSSSDQWTVSESQSARFSDDLNPNWLVNCGHSDGLQLSDDSHQVLESTSECSGNSNSFLCLREGLADSPVSTLFDNELTQVVYSATSRAPKGKKIEEPGINGSRGRKNHQRENIDYLEERSLKQVATYNNDEYAEMEKFDDILISKEGNGDISPSTIQSVVKEVSKTSHQGEVPKGSKSKRKSSRGKTKANKEVVDLRTLLIQAAEATASSDFTTANELLKKIRQHASPCGDSVQRVAHYFANGLEARMNGTGSDLYKASDWKRFTPADILKGYRLYVSNVPFTRTAHFIANQTIAKLAEKASTIHIIDFGIFLGYQWPCFIQSLSRRPFGPPRLKITGVDHPRSGLQPTQSVEETGRRLAGYCQRFGVPFEFKAIAQKWHTLNPEDFDLQKDELTVVSSFFQGRRLPDETVDINSPRDCFLRLIRRLNPDLFINGVINGTYNAPFFITRFREALYQYSSLFDVNEATMLREDHDRILIENYVYGKEAMNVVACEGSERVSRPETYKQWHVRHQRAGFMPVPLDQGIFNRARAMVKANYHKDFMVEQDKHWMVQGWKGRILSAVSCWKPA